jgi:hypothetical protein
MSTFRFSLVLALCTIALLGSSVRAADDATVEGVIALDGEPLPTGARIFFHFGDGQFVGAKVKDGKYKMKAVPAGTYKVTVELSKEGKQLLPPKYSAEDKSELQVEVKKGANTLNFELASK